MAGDSDVTGGGPPTRANATPLAAPQASSVEPGGTGLGGSPFPELELMQQELSDPNMMREFMYLLNNPDILRDTVMSSPRLREIVDRNPELGRKLNDPAIDTRKMEIVSNPERLSEMIRNTDPATYKNILEPLLKATRMGDGIDAGNNLNLTPCAADLGGGDLGGAANPATTGGDLGGADTTTGSPAPSNDPLPNPGAAAGGFKTDHTVHLATTATPAGGGDLGGAETTTGSPAPSTDPLPSPWVAGAGKAVALSPTVTLNVRVLNGTTFAVRASLKAKVDLFKFVIEKNSHVPAAEQRLVFKGQVLNKDDKTLRSYGLEADNTVHLVRGSGGISWNEHAPERMLGPRAYLIGAMRDSNPQFRNIMDNPEFKYMFPEHMALEKWFIALETIFSELTKGPVPPEKLYVTQLAQLEEMGFLDARENLQVLTAHAGDMYATVELLRVLSAFH